MFFYGFFLSNMEKLQLWTKLALEASYSLEMKLVQTPTLCQAVLAVF